MIRRIVQIGIVCAAFVSLNAQPLSSQQAAMGGITTTINSAYHPLDLYGFGGNYAWLQESDSLTWGRYQLASHNDWGTLHRLWDAETVHQNGFIFTGQKRLSDSQLFYGKIAYNRDFYGSVAHAIESDPYAHDPFVLTDTTVGDFNWYGPQVLAVFSQRLFGNLFLGLSVNYGIQRGFKALNSMPEIISRTIGGSVSLAYRLNTNMELGISFHPFDRQDITKLATLPDGTAPLIRRYLGEMVYSEYLTKNDRTANYNGHEERLQFSLHTSSLLMVVLGGYGYLWHELYDGTTQQYFNGFFQEESYFFKTALQKHWNRFVFGMRYGLTINKNWAKEPKGNLRIYDADYFQQDLRVGVLYRPQAQPLLLTAEVSYNEERPNRNDYRARDYRQGKNSKIMWHTGMELNTNNPFRIWAGYIYTQYEEAPVWNYFGDYSGPAFTAGAAYHSNTFEMAASIKYGMVTRTHSHMQHIIQRDHLYFNLELRQFF